MRTIVYDAEVWQDIEAASKNFRLVRESIEGLEWYLSRKPEGGAHRSGIYWVYLRAGFKTERIPDITLLYSFTDDEVTFHAITFRAAR